MTPSLCSYIEPKQIRYYCKKVLRLMLSWQVFAAPFLSCTLAKSAEAKRGAAVNIRILELLDELKWLHVQKLRD